MIDDDDELNDVLSEDSVNENQRRKDVFPSDSCEEINSNPSNPMDDEGRLTNKEARRAAEFRQWTVEPNEVYRPAGQIQDKLGSGVYTVSKDYYGLLFHRIRILTDDLITLPDTANDRVLKAMRKFWNRRSRYSEYGYLYKRGILLWGPPGGGKTATVAMLSRDLISEGGIVIICDRPSLTSNGLAALRRIEPDRPIVCIEEDIDEMVASGYEHDLLALLDGENQVDNIVHVACPAPETRILKADLTWVPAGELHVGDKLVAFDEFGKAELGKERRLRIAAVNSCAIITKKRFRVKTDNVELVVSNKHPFLVHFGDCDPEWRYVEDLRNGDQILSIGQPWTTDTSEEALYLASQYNVEGFFKINDNNTEDIKFRICKESETPTFIKTIEYLSKLGYTTRVYNQKSVDIVGGKWEQIRLLGSIRPINLLENPTLNSILNGTKIHPSAGECVQSVEYIGYGQVVALDTTTKTFIGEGLLQHNTTNYPERLGARIINRPSRFDERIKIGMPSAEARKVYLKHTAKGINEEELEKWVADSEGFSVAHMRELTAAVLCLDQPYDEVISRLKSMKYRIKADEGLGGSTGFHSKEKVNY